MLLTMKSLVLFQLASQLFYGFVLGVVQGISEWLPVSSKTQVLIASTYLFNLPFNQAYTLGLFMEVGTILAAVIYFKKELWEMVKFIIRRGDANGKSLFTYVFVSMIFTGIVGAPIYLIIDSIQGSYNIGIPMLILGLMLIGDALLLKYAKGKLMPNGERRKLADMGIKDFIVIGVAQGIAALPGVSRSGITTSSMLFLNVEADEAFRLSFMNSIFATGAAVLLTVVASKQNIIGATAQIGAPGLLIAIIVSFGISLVLIRFLIQIAKHSKIAYFTAALGVLAIVGGLIAFFAGVGG
ncbi:MAG TPA: undecaprenyl-diphosphate phosphatase [Candidatus Aquilonibacter sp.]|nr:undecaprenyl-diphosphate phosphatase [Candidatus Aquilonibacter sp.]